MKKISAKKRWTELSKLLREQNPKCEVCGITEHLQVHHIISKYWGKSILRFDVQNLVVVCPYCHMYLFHKNPVLTMDWLQHNRTLDYNYLLRVSKGVKII